MLQPGANAQNSWSLDWIFGEGEFQVVGDEFGGEEKDPREAMPWIYGGDRRREMLPLTSTFEDFLFQNDA